MKIRDSVYIFIFGLFIISWLVRNISRFILVWITFMSVCWHYLKRNFWHQSIYSITKRDSSQSLFFSTSFFLFCKFYKFFKFFWVPYVPSNTLSSRAFKGVAHGTSSKHISPPLCYPGTWRCGQAPRANQYSSLFLQIVT